MRGKKKGVHISEILLLSHSGTGTETESKKRLLFLRKRISNRREEEKGRITEKQMGSGSFLKVVARNFDVLVGPLVTLVYPLYASVKAIETKSSIDDQQWLTYWVLYSLITLFELTFAKVIEWLPFWPFAKLIFNCWLVLPYFNGAAYVYQHYVRPLFVNKQTVNIWYVPRKKNIFSRPDDVLLAAEIFIEENGPEAFQKLINKTEKVTKPKKKNKRVTFDDSVVGKESKSWGSNSHVTFNEVEPERDSKTWENSSFMIFDYDNRYQT
ncbi:LOW QUALITY PROTEIN: HVA22-like protein a [Elaeis guineensis]|uniref:LOW QUALITY PROTEIN: HVA22-like protein a n=1 Tax=Elaeis guineensis var. tenera TaxID=51953 RepID=UPI003C6DA5F0